MLKVRCVLRGAFGHVERVDCLVLHENELDNLTLDFSDLKPTELEDTESAALIKDGLTHVIERAVVENDVSHVKLTNGTGIAQNAPD